MSNGPDQDQSADAEEDLIEFHYIKSNFFRVIHCDGAWGGATGEGQVHLSFWNERPAIPKKLVYQLAPDGRLASQREDLREGRDGIVREVEVDVIMNLDTVRAFHSFLAEVIEDFDIGDDEESK